MANDLKFLLDFKKIEEKFSKRVYFNIFSAWVKLVYCYFHKNIFSLDFSLKIFVNTCKCFLHYFLLEVHDFSNHLFKKCFKLLKNKHLKKNPTSSSFIFSSLSN